MGKPSAGPKMVAFILVMTRIGNARKTKQGLSLKPDEVESLAWGVKQMMPTDEERRWLDERRRAGN